MSETFCYAGFAKCGCLVAGVVDVPENKELGKDLKEFVESGLTIERMTIERWKEFKLGHTDACKVINAKEHQQKLL